MWGKMGARARMEAVSQARMPVVMKVRYSIEEVRWWNLEKIVGMV